MVTVMLVTLLASQGYDSLTAANQNSIVSILFLLHLKGNKCFWLAGFIRSRTVSLAYARRVSKLKCLMIS